MERPDVVAPCAMAPCAKNMANGAIARIVPFLCPVLAVMNNQRNKIYIFAQLRLDACQRLLFAGNELVSLRPKAFDTLLALVENRGSVMSKEELMKLLWADEFVEENNLAQHIHTIRKSLGDGGDGAKYIETIPKRGY